MVCPKGTQNCIKESEKHDTCHIMSDTECAYCGSFEPNCCRYFNIDKERPSTRKDGNTVYLSAKDTEVKTTYSNSSGAVKNDTDKYDPTMLSKEMVELVSRVRMFGAKKYSRGNWKKGFKQTRSLAAALRHLFAYLGGEDNDPESGLSHLGHAICSIEHCIYDAVHRPENDDRKE